MSWSLDAQLRQLTEKYKDERIPLEDSDDPQTIEYIEKQNSKTDRILGTAIAPLTLHLAGKNPYYPPPDEFTENFVYRFSVDPDHPRGLWKRASAKSYRDASPDWEILLDVGKIIDDSLHWQSHCLSPDEQHAMLQLQKGGTNQFCFKEFDLNTGKLSANGFQLPFSTNPSVLWVDNHTLLVSTPMGAGAATKTYGNHTVQKWHAGETFEEASVIFECPEDHFHVHVDSIDCNAGDQTSNINSYPLIFSDNIAMENHVHYLGTADGPKVKLDVPRDTHPQFEGDCMLVQVKQPWTIDKQTYPRSAVLVFSVSRFLAGHPGPMRVFEPDPRMTVESTHLMRGHVIVSLKDKLKPHILILSQSTPEGNGLTKWTAKELPLPDHITQVSVSVFDKRNGEFLVTMSSPICPKSEHLVSLNTLLPKLLSQPKPDFDATNMSVKHFEVLADDGYSLGYTISGPPFEKGQAYILVQASTTWGRKQIAGYSDYVGTEWLAKGGSVVHCDIRGGGGYLTDQHIQGRGTLKHVAHQDLVDIITHLQQNGTTTPDRTVGTGWGWEGQTMASMITYFPTIFAAVHLQHPIIDLLRQTQMSGRPPEMLCPEHLGDPEDPVSWTNFEHILSYGHESHHLKQSDSRIAHKLSSLEVDDNQKHNLHVLITTSSTDTYNHPGHARKFAATLQARPPGIQNGAVLFYETESNGDSIGKMPEERARSWSQQFTFFRRAVCMEGPPLN